MGQSTEAVSQSDVSDCRSALFSRFEGLFFVLVAKRGWQTGLLRRQSGHASEIQIEYGEEMERVTGIEPA